MSDEEHIMLILPSLKVSGGTLELLRLADDLAAKNRLISIVSLWRSPHETSMAKCSVRYLSEWRTNAKSALLQLPILVGRFSRLVKSISPISKRAGTGWIFSHYATFPLALCVSRDRRWFFVQDLEWRFIRNPVLSALLKWMILSAYRRGHLISANSYLTSQLALLGLVVEAETPIWADPGFQGSTREARDIDVVMMLRKGDAKRLDLYLNFLALVESEKRPWKLAAITPESAIALLVKGKVSECLLRPSMEQMQKLYARSKCFLHLSDHEGFGLPPLEAMGSGCVPICRDSGGIRAYMNGDLESLVEPKSLDMSQFVARTSELVDDVARLATMSGVAEKVFARGLAQAQKRLETLALLRFR
jgi:glycosyltransferase involved in cell wall biosynthesis